MSKEVAVAFITAVPALIAALAAWRTHARVKHETSPNSGSSLRDTVDRIERDVADLRLQVSLSLLDTAQHVAEIRAELAAMRRQ